MKDVIILAAHRSLVQKAETLIAQDRLERVGTLFCGTVEEIVDFVTNRLPPSAEVLVTMPGIAVLLEEVLRDTVPVLAVEYNNIDIVTGLRDALSFCPESVALGHYKEENPRIADIRKLVGQPFRNFIFGNADTINKTILRKLREQGISAVVGGGYICNLAQELGFSVFPLEVNASTLRTRIKSACSIADTRRFMRHSKRNIDIILENQAEAVISVNCRNEITFFNKSAETVLGMAGGSVLGKKSLSVLPSNGFEAVLNTKKSIENRIHSVRGIDIIGDYRPVLDKGAVIGAVGTFSPMQQIRQKEELLRRHYAPDSTGSSYSFKDFHIGSPCFRSLLEQAECFALSDETILITGESGTGKEVMANSIHNAGGRKDKPFIAVNCASIPSALLESELFGYAAGAFTGSRKNGAAGLFEAAHGGTLFLDEISEMPFEFQAKLLRVIQEKKIRKVGSPYELPVDVRIIAATNRVPEQEVAKGRFRMDLYYRLNVFHIHMPPLREYADKAGDIAEKMLLRFAPQAGNAEKKHLRSLLDSIGLYGWPGNLRELENSVRRYAALGAGLKRPLVLDDVFTRASFREQKTEPLFALENSERRRIAEAVEKFHGNRGAAAKELGISRSTLWRKLKNFG